MTPNERASDEFSRDIGFGFLDRTVRSPRALNPQIVLNEAPNSMLRTLRHEIVNASSFSFSVAFVTSGAVALLKQELTEFQGTGTIITSDYLGFNSPSAFDELLALKRFGIDVRLHSDRAFHAKGYVFHRSDGVTAILGSSNLTEGALTQNHEWNLKVSASRDSDLGEQFTNLVDLQVTRSAPLTQDWIDEYAKSYEPLRSIAGRRRAADSGIQIELEDTDGTIEPNRMQEVALSEISKMRGSGAHRALVISATGTGKTILAALDVRAAAPRRMLFIAHREQILDRAIREFQRVLEAPLDDFGKVVGQTRQQDRQYVFATVQTLSRPDVLAQFTGGEFDYIIIDEVHRAAAGSFSRVIEHFHPLFLLGMTATPERSDEADIFEIFDHNVAYEIRLNAALELGMLSPFHYYGVADYTFEDGTTTEETISLSRLVSSDRVEHILRAIEKYGQAGPQRGLIFCSRREEAETLSRELNARTLRGSPLRTVALTGENSIEDREREVERLEAGELDYILTVDVFNEGVDIPSLNQVIMLRQTKSSIVFVQQLGRGLRKFPGKDYLVVVDFIGNYANNYLIPIALFGDDSLNRESLRKNLIAAEEAGVVAGLSSIRFDQIAQARVLRSLEKAKLDSLHNLKSAIQTVWQRIGRTPRLADFLRFESVDPVVLATKVGSFPALLEKLFPIRFGLGEPEQRLLSVVSRELLQAKRPHELLLLRALLERESLALPEIEALFAENGISALPTHSAVRSLSLEFNTTPERTQYGVDGLVSREDGKVSLTPELSHAYRASESFRTHLDDVLQTGLDLISERYGEGDPFALGLQYSRKDASRLLNWTSNQQGTIYGYKVDKATSTCPIFVTLNKSEEVSERTAYRDELIDVNTLVWDTRNGLTLASKEVASILNGSVDIYVFAKKSDADGTGFYFLGRATPEGAFETSLPGSEGKTHSVVRMNLRFDSPVSTGLFDYFGAKASELPSAT